MDTENGAQVVEGLNLNLDGSSGAGDNSPATDVSASAGVIKERKRRSDAGQSRGSRGGGAKAGVPAVPAQTLTFEQFKALYDPKIWGRCLAAPGDAMAAMSGKKHWEISDNEREALGATGSVAAQAFATSDPRYLALALCAITVLEVYGLRLAKDYAEEKAKRNAELERKKNLFDDKKQQAH